MRCPRCETSVDDAAARCPECGAPLQLLDEPPPSRLDRALDLDRRRRRATPVPSAPPPADPVAHAADMGDLSFDPPPDDSAWTFGARRADDDGDEASALDTPAPIEPLPAASEPLAAAVEAVHAAVEPAVVLAVRTVSPDDEPASAPVDEPAATADADEPLAAAWEQGTDGVALQGTDAAWEQDADADHALEVPLQRSAVTPPALALFAAAKRPTAAADHEDDHEDDDDEELPPAVALDASAARRGRLLSLASIAIAGTVALIAVLTSR